MIIICVQTTLKIQPLCYFYGCIFFVYVCVFFFEIKYGLEPSSKLGFGGVILILAQAQTAAVKL